MWKTGILGTRVTEVVYFPFSSFYMENVSCLSREYDGQAQYSIPGQNRFVGLPWQCLGRRTTKVCLAHIHLLVIMCTKYHMKNLKEKLPQAFMQIGWMKKWLKNPTAKVWANFENPSKSYDFSNFWLISCMLPSQGHFATIYDVTTVQLSNGTLYKFHKIVLFRKMHLPSTLILRYVRAKMTLNAFMIELDQLHYWYPRKF